MDDQACEEALTGLSAYYKAARKTYVDNVGRQVIERHLLNSLPKIFCPDSVAAWDDDVLMRVAAETPGNAEKRKGLKALLKELEGDLQDLRR